jgi:hypothetical protein
MEAGFFLLEKGGDFMLTLALALTAVTVVAELLLLYKSDTLLAMFKQNTIVAAVFSVALSWLLGIFFGAVGMVVLFAAIASTVVTTLVYKSGVLVAAKRLGEGVSNRK